MLAVEGLVAGYGAARVLDGVDLTVRRGEVVGLAGRNGAGKTTLLCALSGAVRKRSGKVLVDGTQLASSPTSVARAGIAHVPEGRGMLPNLTAAENIRLGAAAVGRPMGRELIEETVALFPRLAPVLSRKAGALSGGEQQLVALARGLAARPRLLMADEISLGLSPKAASEVFDLAVEVCRTRGISMLVVDQNARTMARACDRMYVLHGGRAVEIPHDHEGDAYAELYFRGVDDARSLDRS
jgi:branched-chain amino acid transport system ATP-binding protein